MNSAFYEFIILAILGAVKQPSFFAGYQVIDPRI
jgi:hypothetical protein